MNDVSDTFIRFLKMVRTQAKISTRELAEVANKSNAYVSILENGKIKTIDYTTAYKMLVYLNEKKPFITGSINGDTSSGALIHDMLIRRFDILPEEDIQREIMEAENRDRIKLEELKIVGDKLNIIKSMVEDEYLADTLLVITEAKLEYLDVRVLTSCLPIIKNSNKVKALKMFVDILNPKTGIYIPHLNSEKNKEFYTEIEQLLIDYKFI
jgi:transcriptional regulator with XRE-family HTH domain